MSNVISGTSNNMKSSSNDSLALTKETTTTEISAAVKKQTQSEVSSCQPLPVLPAGVQMPMFIVSNCTFSGCSVAISGQQATCQYKSTEEQICEETLKDIDIAQIFD